MRFLDLTTKNWPQNYFCQKFKNFEKLKMVLDLEKLLEMTEEKKTRTPQDNYHPLLRQFTTGLDSPKCLKPELNIIYEILGN